MIADHPAIRKYWKTNYFDDVRTSKYWNTNHPTLANLFLASSTPSEDSGGLHGDLLSATYMSSAFNFIEIYF